MPGGFWTDMPDYLRFVVGRNDVIRIDSRCPLPQVHWHNCKESYHDHKRHISLKSAVECACSHTSVPLTLTFGTFSGNASAPGENFFFGGGVLGHVPLLGSEGAVLPGSVPWVVKLVSGYTALKKFHRNFHRRYSQKRFRRPLTLIGAVDGEACFRLHRPEKKINRN